VFPTVSKPSADRLLGESGLRRMAAAVRVPILAIGGVTVERAPAIAAGAPLASRALAFPAVGDLAPKVAAEVRAQFDRVGRGSPAHTSFDGCRASNR
jgi:thiamine monophosphate synthase